MQRSENIGALAAALAKAQGDIHSASKATKNTFFNSSYADLASVMDACRAPLSKNGLAVIQSTQFDTGGKWIETILAHSSGEWISSHYPVKPVKDDPQGMGSAVTYARRYALMALVGIVADDDDDGNAASNHTNGNGHAKAPEPAKRPVATKPDDEAAKWAEWATTYVNGIKTASALRKWEQANEAGMTNLKLVDRALWSDLNMLLEERHVALTTAQASA